MEEKPVDTAPLSAMGFKTTLQIAHIPVVGVRGRTESLPHSFKEGERNWTYLPTGEVKHVL